MKNGVWHSVSITESHHKMKYNVNSKIPTDWDQGYLNKLMSNIKKTLLDKIVGTTENYIIGKQNLSKTTEKIHND